MDKNNDILQEAIDERIDSFIRGTLSEEEESAFKQEIKADPELRKHVLATVSLIKGIREQDAQKERNLIRNKAVDRARTLLKWACSIAAVYAIIFAYQKDKQYNERAALKARLNSDVDLIGIVHWGLNTYTDREWGFGDEDPQAFNPTEFDAEQIVKACRDGGITGIIIVCKHHDGLCLWPTKTTEHN